MTTTLAVYTGARNHGVAGRTKEWPSHGVNAIGPGYMVIDHTQAAIPAGRGGTADDLVGATVFLASDAADLVNGTVRPVDGGLGR